MGDVDNGGGCAQAGSRGYMGNLCTFLSIFALDNFLFWVLVLGFFKVNIYICIDFATVGTANLP